jgi:hypothetical protein
VATASFVGSTGPEKDGSIEEFAECNEFASALLLQLLLEDQAKKLELRDERDLQVFGFECFAHELVELAKAAVAQACSVELDAARRVRSSPALVVGFAWRLP